MCMLIEMCVSFVKILQVNSSRCLYVDLFNLSPQIGTKDQLRGRLNGMSPRNDDLMSGKMSTSPSIA